MSDSLILASASPRRRELLAQLGVSFSVQPADIDESVLAAELPGDYVLRMAREKAQKVIAANPGVVVLASDTSVVVDEFILGKPKDRADGMAMLQRLSGRSHKVLTAIAVGQGSELTCQLIETQVQFCHISESEQALYWQTGEPSDKAGGYAIQGIGGRFVTQIQGSYSSVVGLPLAETAALLEAFAIKTWQQRDE